MPDFSIIPLSKEYAKICAQFSFDEWGQYIPGVTLQDNIDRYQKTADIMAAENNIFPKTWIAVDNNVKQCLGMISLKNCDGSNYPVPGFSLASLYVAKTSRLRGIGRALCEHLFTQAKKYGADHLHLFTGSGDKELSTQKYYELMGFIEVGRTYDPTGQSKDLPLMRKEL